TRLPVSAKHVPTTRPTYPVPMTEIFMGCLGGEPRVGPWPRQRIGGTGRRTVAARRVAGNFPPGGRSGVTGAATIVRMWRWPAALACAALASACVVSETVSTLDRESPPSHLGRPGWVRATARVGAWTGAVVGAVASVALLPVTWPISQLAD